MAVTHVLCERVCECVGKWVKGGHQLSLDIKIVFPDVSVIDDNIEFYLISSLKCVSGSTYCSIAERHSLLARYESLMQF